MAERYAIFDVDETLINFKTMISFYRYLKSTLPTHNWLYTWLRCRQFLKRLMSLDRDEQREMVDYYYYREFHGLPKAQLDQAVTLWWGEIGLDKAIFNHKVLACLRGLQSQGVKILLISGSFYECLEPVRDHVQADDLIAARLQVCHGTLTGQVENEIPVGVKKAQAIVDYFADHSIVVDYENSYAFADHVTDLPMLKLFGNAYLVASGVPYKLDMSRQVFKSSSSALCPSHLPGLSS